MADVPQAPAPKPRRGKLVIVITVLFLLLAGGAGGGFWWWRRSAHAQAQPEKAPAPQGAAILSLEPFLVNLADKESSRFLRVSLRLVIDEEHDLEVLEQDTVRLARIRSAILEVLTMQQSDLLVTPEGKTALKHAIAERSTAVLNLEVRDVLFTDFVVQF